MTAEFGMTAKHLRHSELPPSCHPAIRQASRHVNQPRLVNRRQVSEKKLVFGQLLCTWIFFNYIDVKNYESI